MLWSDGEVSTGKGFFQTHGADGAHTSSIHLIIASSSVQRVEVQGLKWVVHSSTVELFSVAATLCSPPWLFMVPELRRGIRLWPSKHGTKLLNSCLQLGDEELFAMSIPPAKVVPVWDSAPSSKTAQGQRAIAATRSSHSQDLLSLT